MADHIERGMTEEAFKEFLRVHEDGRFASLAECNFALGTDGDLLIDTVKLRVRLPCCRLQRRAPR